MKSFAHKVQRSSRGETVLVFFVGPHRLAICATALDEIRKDPTPDSCRGADISIVSAHKVLGVEALGTRLLVLRHGRVGVCVDSMERMIEIAVVHPLPWAFCGRERSWYRGLALVQDKVIPVVDAQLFLREAETGVSSIDPVNEIKPSAPRRIVEAHGGAKGRQPFVIFPLGRKRFALPISVVAELSQLCPVQEFPHTTVGLAGVLVRRGGILPVWDVKPMLLGDEAPAHKFFLIVRRKVRVGDELTAIPVTGECRMVQAEMAPAADAPAFVYGVLMHAGEPVECLDLEQLAHAQFFVHREAQSSSGAYESR